MENDFASEAFWESADISKPVIWSIINALLKLIADAEKDYRQGDGVRYLPPALEHLACMLRKHMDSPNERLDTMRANFVRSDPYFYVAMDKLGFSCLRNEEKTDAPPPVPWAHDWTEDDAEFEDDETEEETDATAPKNEGK